MRVFSPDDLILRGGQPVAVRYFAEVYSSPDGSGNPDIALNNYDEIASFLAMTDCNGQREEK
ncbi:hypothetical protein [Flavobacterium sangjuense]|uniref:hypothetical protein n=1 Tax=Flavobacterium sangjuense TaxID=2518177 RepID=UPI00109E290F|nr:hypothetical protein [Flavobacterium sangjuense]